MFVVLAFYPSATTASGEAFTRRSFRSLAAAVEYATSVRGARVEIHNISE